MSKPFTPLQGGAQLCGAHTHEPVSRALTRTVAGWTVAGADEPRIKDVELAERLGFERPRKIRDLIRQHQSAGNLNDFDVCPTAGRTSPLGGRPGVEFWLTEDAALWIIVKSETPKARAITREVIQVFIAARKGLLEAPRAELPANRERAALAVVLRDLPLLDDGRGVTIGELVERLYSVPQPRFAELRDALETLDGRPGKPSPKAVGDAFRRLCGCVVDGQRIERRRDAQGRPLVNRQGAVRWVVADDQPGGDRAIVQAWLEDKLRIACTGKPLDCRCIRCAGVTTKAVLAGAFGINHAAMWFSVRIAEVLVELGWAKGSQRRQDGDRVRPYFPPAPAALPPARPVRALPAPPGKPPSYPNAVEALNWLRGRGRLTTEIEAALWGFALACPVDLDAEVWALNFAALARELAVPMAAE